MSSDDLSDFKPASDSTDPMGIGDNIRALRGGKRMGDGRAMSQGDLASVLDVTPQAISNWERGKDEPTSDKVAAMSAYFGVSIDEMYGRRRPVPAPQPNPPAPSAKIETSAALAAITTAISILRPDFARADAEALAGVFLSLALQPPDLASPTPPKDQLRFRF